MEKDISVDSSASFKWGLFVLVDNKWSSVAFFKTERAAKKFAACLVTKDMFLIARRYDRRELIASRGM